MQVLRSALFFFRIWIIHEGELLHCLSSGLSSFKPGQYLSYNLLLGNNQEICPVVLCFFKGCSQGRCPEQEKDKPIRISLSLFISAAHFDISALFLSVQLTLIWWICLDSCRCSSSTRHAMASDGMSLNV